MHESCRSYLVQAAAKATEEALQHSNDEVAKAESTANEARKQSNDEITKAKSAADMAEASLAKVGKDLEEKVAQLEKRISDMQAADGKKKAKFMTIVQTVKVLKARNEALEKVVKKNDLKC